jgi:hypothetical protein
LTLVAHRKRIAQAKRNKRKVFKAWDRSVKGFIWYEGSPLPEVAHDS